MPFGKADLLIGVDAARSRPLLFAAGESSAWLA